MNGNLSRRDFLKLAGITSVGIALSACSVKTTESPTPRVTSLPPTETPGPTTTPLNPNEYWRPFSDDSPWNTPIGFDPEIDPDSDAIIDTLRDSISEGHFGINYNAWTIPVYYADANTPTYTVRCLNNWGCGCETGFMENVPIPDGAIPDPMDDHHMAVVDLSRQCSWDLWRAQAVPGGWETGSGCIFDLNGTGVLPDGVGSARASGFPLLAGLIWLAEIQRGYIDHALVMAYDFSCAEYVYPASTPDNSGGPYAIPNGGHIQLDPSLDLDTLGLSPVARTIARALQEYGAYKGDVAGGIVLYAEGLYGKWPLTWDGFLTGDDIAGIPFQHFRVLKLPPFKTW